VYISCLPIPSFLSSVSFLLPVCLKYIPIIIIIIIIIIITYIIYIILYYIYIILYYIILYYIIYMYDGRLSLSGYKKFDWIDWDSASTTTTTSNSFP